MISVSDPRSNSGQNLVPTTPRNDPLTRTQKPYTDTETPDRTEVRVPRPHEGSRGTCQLEIFPPGETLNPSLRAYPPPGLRRVRVRSWARVATTSRRARCRGA